MLDAYRTGTASPAEVLDATVARIAAHGDPAVWIGGVDGDAVRDRGDRTCRDAIVGGALDGIPFAVKDNIDVAGLPTTAGCPAFDYAPVSSATAVDRAVTAGGVVVGKTNLDQFATGLVGTRSPYGIPTNPFDSLIVPGGSSSGSGVAVAAGLVPFALGTDTAGSGRIPAALGNIVGLQADARARQHRRRGAGLPFARLRLGVRPDRARRGARARGARCSGRGRHLRPAEVAPPSTSARRGDRHRDRRAQRLDRRVVRRADR